jgi:hypothetical protein
MTVNHQSADVENEAGLNELMSEPRRVSRARITRTQ